MICLFKSIYLSICLLCYYEWCPEHSVSVKTFCNSLVDCTWVCCFHTFCCWHLFPVLVLLLYPHFFILNSIKWVIKAGMVQAQYRYEPIFNVSIVSGLRRLYWTVQVSALYFFLQIPLCFLLSSDDGTSFSCPSNTRWQL